MNVQKSSKAISFFLALMLILTVVLPAFAAQSDGLRLLNIYGDNMIFQQEQPAVINGYYTPGARISAELYDSRDNYVIGGYDTVSEDGKFSLSFQAPSGSFDNYTVKISEGSKLLGQLNNVAFGEVWLASGQSNMQYPLVQDKTGSEMFKRNQPFSPWLRIFKCEGITRYQGSDKNIPYDPQEEIEGCYWATGTDYGISAVAYWFAVNLMDELDMPIGIINASLGGSSIDSWLSREAIDGDAEVKQDMIDAGTYIDHDKWQTMEHTQAYDMTADYNLKINPLKPFTFAGIIWYQGETDCAFNFKWGRYSRAVNLLQKSWSELFAPEGETLPFIFTTLASCNYGSVRTCYDLNLEFADIQQEDPESRALISIYDVSLDYLPEVGFIHPSTKQPVGVRMTHSAMGLVYGKDDTYTTATVSSAETRDSSIFVTFRNTGKGLKCDGALNGFSVCAEDGIYIPASAEIVSPDTIRVSAEGITSPASAAYAYGLSNCDSNLFSESENGYLMPVSTFVTKKIKNARYIDYTAWMDCEKLSSMRVINPSDMSMFYENWYVKNGNIRYENDSAFSGNNGIHLTSEKKKATIQPAFNYHRHNRDYTCSDVVTDYSDYDTVSFMVRNNSDKDASVSSVRVYLTDLVWYSPVSENGTFDAKIPADNQWHKVTFSLNSLKLWGMKNSSAFGNEKLDKIRYLKINLSSKSNLDFSLDEFRFSSDNGKIAETQKSSMYAFDQMLQVLCSLLVKIDRLIY